MKRFIKTILVLTAFLVIAPTMAFADTTYKVQKGDTLFSISRKQQITVEELRVANNLSNKDFIKIGQTLIIPSADITAAAALTQKPQPKTTTQTNKAAPNTKPYIIQTGDTLYGIARKYNIKIAVLLNLNNIDTTAVIKAGQKLLIPSEAYVAKKEQPKPITSEEDKSKERLARAKGIEWPLENPKVRSITGKVSGVELTGREGESVKTVREGTVMYTGVYRGFGQVVFVQSKTGLIYSYTGLKTVDTKKGEYVAKGDAIGAVGSGNDASIKFMVFQNGVPLDPIKAPRG